MHTHRDHRVPHTYHRVAHSYHQVTHRCQHSERGAYALSSSDFDRALMRAQHALAAVSAGGAEQAAVVAAGEGTGGEGAAAAQEARAADLVCKVLTKKGRMLEKKALKGPKGEVQRGLRHALECLQKAEAQVPVAASAVQRGVFASTVTGVVIPSPIPSHPPSASSRLARKCTHARTHAHMRLDVPLGRHMCAMVAERTRSRSAEAGGGAQTGRCCKGGAREWGSHVPRRPACRCCRVLQQGRTCRPQGREVIPVSSTDLLVKY